LATKLVQHSVWSPRWAAPVNRGCPLLDITDTWGLEDNKAARRTSMYSLIKLTSLQEITILSCV